MLEELILLYPNNPTLNNFTQTLIDISTNEQKKDWFLRLDPNGRIPVLVDKTKNPPFTVMETSAELLYLLKEYDERDELGFKDELERNMALQWLFFWHGSGAPYQVRLYPILVPPHLPPLSTASLSFSTIRKKKK